MYQTVTQVASNGTATLGWYVVVEASDIGRSLSGEASNNSRDLRAPDCYKRTRVKSGKARFGQNLQVFALFDLSAATDIAAAVS